MGFKIRGGSTSHVRVYSWGPQGGPSQDFLPENIGAT